MAAGAATVTAGGLTSNAAASTVEAPLVLPIVTRKLGGPPTLDFVNQWEYRSKY